MTDTDDAPEPRTLVITQRGFRPQVSRCVGYELEDVIAAHSRSQWATLAHTPLGRMPEVAVNRLNKRFRVAARLPAPLVPQEVEGEVDVAVAVMQLPADVVTVNSVRDWRARSHRAVCFVEEMWAAELDRWQGHQALLEQFDHVFLGSWGTVEPLGELLDTPVSYLPYSVDTLRFAPTDLGAPRFIDVCNIGRHSAVTHEALVRLARERGIFYYHDTFTPGPCSDITEHREQLARLLRATDVAITNRGIGARPHETGGQLELGFRYFEASAAGALMVGEHPPIPVVDELFDWPDAVIDASFDAPTIARLLDELAADPERVASVRRNSVINALGRHDHIHRWQTMLDAVGFASGACVHERLSHLDAAANRL
ncbi:MAG: glycosyltransferase [Acidimicrobiia bacterium]|nr:glycosyltransferase [Acidimicrobiia bacterium]